MIELRWVEFGPNKQLEYRTKIYSGRRLDASGKTPDVWSDWVVVPTVSGDDAALGDVMVDDNIINLSDFRPIGNGGREAMIDVMGRAPAQCLGKWDAPTCTDWILAMLWYEGFKIVPLEPSDHC